MYPNTKKYKYSVIDSYFLINKLFLMSDILQYSISFTYKGSFTKYFWRVKPHDYVPVMVDILLY